MVTYNKIEAEFAKVRQLSEDRYRIAKEASFLLEAAYCTWFRSIMSQSEGRRYLDEMRALYVRIQDHIASVKCSVACIEVLLFHNRP